MLCAGGMLFHGLNLYKRLGATSKRELYTDKRIRLAALKRVNIALTILTFTYVLRFFTLIVLTYDLSTSQYFAGKMTELGWFIMNLWVPTVVPVIISVIWIKIKWGIDIHSIYQYRKSFYLNYFLLYYFRVYCCYISQVVEIRAAVIV